MIFSKNVHILAFQHFWLYNFLHMKRVRLFTAIFLTSLFLSGCASHQGRIGSLNWYNARTAEIEKAYENNEIDKAEYLKLKNEADSIRSAYQNSDIHSHSHIGYGHRRGTSIGIGVGF